MLTKLIVIMGYHTLTFANFVFLFRRERASTLNISAEPEADFLDLEEHLISPSSIYAGTGGKPPLAFAMDTKSHRKRCVVVG